MVNFLDQLIDLNDDLRCVDVVTEGFVNLDSGAFNAFIELKIFRCGLLWS